jgi:hypothetical protein
MPQPLRPDPPKIAAAGTIGTRIGGSAGSQETQQILCCRDNGLVRAAERIGL